MDKIAEIATRENVREFARNYRTMADKGLVGAELTVPKEIIGAIMQDMDKYSKLYSYVTVKDVKGNAKEAVMGTIPEAVWQDACAALNELDLTFRVVDVGAWKVGGYIPTCNALATDNDVDLLRELADAMGGAIGYALDYAIVYGDGQRQPKGAATDLKKIDVTGAGAAAIAKMIRAASAAKGTYSRENRKLWLMNADTLDVIRAAAVYAAGTGIVGGILDNVITLNFIPDGEIIAGYFDLYLLAERQDVRVRVSEDAHFIEDETIVKATARYDGVPVIPEAFARIEITATDPQPGGTPEPINITENGTYTRDEGYSPVTVDVPSEDTLGQLLAGTLAEYTNADITELTGYTFGAPVSLERYENAVLNFPNLVRISVRTGAGTQSADYAFYGFAGTINAPKLERIYGGHVFEYSNIGTLPKSLVSVSGAFIFGHCNKLTEIDLPDADTFTGSSIASDCVELTRVNLPRVTGIPQNAFARCKKLEHVTFGEQLTDLGAYAFTSCIALQMIDIPGKLVSPLTYGTFEQCEMLRTAKFASVGKISSTTVFNKATSLTALVIGYADDTRVCTLDNVNAFKNTPIESGTGYVYVPDALVDTYKTATNWATYASRIRPLSEYTESE